MSKTKDHPKFTVTIRRSLLEEFEYRCKSEDVSRNRAVVELIKAWVGSKVGPNDGAQSGGTHRGFHQWVPNFPEGNRDALRDKIREDQREIPPSQDSEDFPLGLSQKAAAKTETMVGPPPQKSDGGNQGTKPPSKLTWHRWSRQQSDWLKAALDKVPVKTKAALEECFHHQTFSDRVERWWVQTCPGSCTPDSRPIHQYELARISCLAKIFRHHGMAFPLQGPLTTDAHTFGSIQFPTGLGRMRSDDAAETFVNTVKSQLTYEYDLAADGVLLEKCRDKFAQLAMKDDDFFKPGNKKSWSWLGSSKDEAKKAYASKLKGEFEKAVAKLDARTWIRAKLGVDDPHIIDVGLMLFPAVTLTGEEDSDD